MSTYAIGDVQGCFATLQRLLKRCNFDPAHDTVWLAGDLVNRGPDSLGVLRWARELGDRVVAVLGNHDLRLLSVAHNARQPGPNDTLNDVLQADDRAELIHWLQHRPLLHYGQGHLLLHAGVVPSWTLEDALEYAHEVQIVLRGPHAPELLAQMSGFANQQWQTSLQGIERLTMIIRVATYMRVCNAADELCLDFTGTPQDAPVGFAPWFTWKHRQTRHVPIVCGHWSALGLHRADNINSLDTGCVWGQSLTALRLEDGVIFQEPAVS